MKNKGFTLIELSIVIVIIGLIVAGISAGSSLVKSSKIRSFITQINEYKTAANNFFDQYEALPGDFREASQYWPACSPTEGANACDGDDDGIIGSGASGEDLRAWEHLALAGLIKGDFPGVASVTPNTPDSTIEKAVIELGFSGPVWGSYERVGNIIFLRNVSHTLHPVLPATVAQSIDKEIDDGVADGGKVYGIMGITGDPCVTNSGTVAPSEYILTSTNQACRMMIYLD